jgi:hypothetical protein
MKRFIAVALLAAIAGGAYANPVPLLANTKVFDFSASVKNTNIKIVQVPMPITTTVKSRVKPPTVDFMVKYLQSTELYGYLIVPAFMGQENGSKAGPEFDIGQSWAVIANSGIFPKVGRLFYAEPVQMQLFDLKSKKGNPTELPVIVTFGTEGGLVLYQGENEEGDNILVDDAFESVQVNKDYNGVGMLGEYDNDGMTWLAAAGFGTGKMKARNPNIPGEYGFWDPMFEVSLAGSVIGGWNHTESSVTPDYGKATLLNPVEWWFFGYPAELYFYIDGSVMNSWIVGTWSIKPNTRLRPITKVVREQEVDVTHGPCYTAAALKAINPKQDIDDAEDYDEYP